MTDYRAVVDGTITFSNGGGDHRRGVPARPAGRRRRAQAEIGRLLVASLGLLMADEVTLSRVEVVEEPHKGTRGGPSEPAGRVGRGASTGWSSSATRSAPAWSRCPGCPVRRSRRT